jgi:hypothetical protein
MKVIIAIILIVIIIILSFNNIINEYFINSSQITCGTTDNNIDVTCNLYNTKKSLLIDIQSAYNLAKKTTEDKYDLWIFSKNNVSLKKAVLDQANIVDTHLKNKNAIELIINIIKSIIYAKAAVTIINYQMNIKMQSIPLIIMQIMHNYYKLIQIMEAIILHRKR